MPTFWLEFTLEFKPKRRSATFQFPSLLVLVYKTGDLQGRLIPLSLSGCSSWESTSCPLSLSLSQGSEVSPRALKLKFWVMLSLPSSGLWPAPCGGECKDLWEDEASLRDQLPDQIPLQGRVHPAPHPHHPLPGEWTMGHAQNYLHESWVLWRQTSGKSERAGWFKIIKKWSCILREEQIWQDRLWWKKIPSLQNQLKFSSSVSTEGIKIYVSSNTARKSWNQQVPKSANGSFCSCVCACYTAIAPVNHLLTLQVTKSKCNCEMKCSQPICNTILNKFPTFFFSLLPSLCSLHIPKDLL